MHDIIGADNYRLQCSTVAMFNVAMPCDISDGTVVLPWKYCLWLVCVSFVLYLNGIVSNLYLYTNFLRMLRSCCCGWFVGKTEVGQGQWRDNSPAANMLPIVVDIAIKFVFRVTECHQFLPPRTLNMIIMGKGQWSIFRKIDLKAFIIRTSIKGHQSLTIDNGN